eukprot:144354-Prymnesium_polylepis.3
MHSGQRKKCVRGGWRGVVRHSGHSDSEHFGQSTLTQRTTGKESIPSAMPSRKSHMPDMNM